MGVSPEEVGLSYPSLLAQSLYLLVIMIPWGILIALIAAPVARIITTPPQNPVRKHGRITVTYKPDRPRNLWLLIICFVTASTLVALTLGAPEIARRFAIKARRGEIVQTLGFQVQSLLSNDEPMLAFRAVPTRLTVLDKDASALKALESNRHLQFLGHDDKYIILYDYAAQKTLRIPLDSISLESAVLPVKSTMQIDPLLLGIVFGVGTTALYIALGILIYWRPKVKWSRRDDSS
jgi:hypothetical protein